MKKFLIFFLTLALPFLLLFCDKNSNSVGPGDIDYGSIQTIEYAKHVQPLLNEYAKILQDAAVFPPGLQMDSWENLIKGWERGEVIIPFDSDNSLLIELTRKLSYTNKLDSVKINFLARWIDEGAKNDAGETPYASAQNLLYVCSQGESIINIIDADALVVIRNVDLTDFGFPRSSKAHHIAFSPDRQFWFVSCIDNQVNKVLKFTVADNQLVGEFDGFIPALMDHHPTENTLYVSKFTVNNPTSSITAINTQTMEGFDGGDGTILFPPNLAVLHAMRVDHSGTYVYTASFSEDVFLVVENAGKSFVDQVILGNDRTPVQIGVTPDDQKAYVSCIGTGEVVVIDMTDTANRHIETAVPVGGQPWHNVFSSDGSKFYVGNLGLDKFHVINTADFSFQSFGAGDGSDGLSQPHGIDIHPNGQRVFISGRNTSGNYHPVYDFGDNATIGTVVVINTADNSIEKVIEIENFGSGMRLLSK